MQERLSGENLFRRKCLQFDETGSDDEEIDIDETDILRRDTKLWPKDTGDKVKSSTKTDGTNANSVNRKGNATDITKVV